MLLQMAGFHPILWLSNIPYYISTMPSLSNHLLKDIGYFHELMTVSSAAMNMDVHISLQKKCLQMS